MIDESKLLPNAQMVSRVYDSRPHPSSSGSGQEVHRLHVSPQGDPELARHLERAQHYAGVGRSAEERMALLFHYAAHKIDWNDKARNSQYTTPSGGGETTTPEGHGVKEAQLGQCLSHGAACREQSALLQILLANEGIASTMASGDVENPRIPTGGSDRHAWLELGHPGEPQVLDPTTQEIHTSKHSGLGYGLPSNTTAFAQPSNPIETEALPKLVEGAQTVAYGLANARDASKKSKVATFFSKKPSQEEKQYRDLYAAAEKNLSTFQPVRSLQSPAPRSSPSTGSAPLPSAVPQLAASSTLTSSSSRGGGQIPTSAASPPPTHSGETWDPFGLGPTSPPGASTPTAMAPPRASPGTVLFDPFDFGQPSTPSASTPTAMAPPRASPGTVLFDPFDFGQPSTPSASTPTAMAPPRASPGTVLFDPFDFGQPTPLHPLLSARSTSTTLAPAPGPPQTRPAASADPFADLLPEDWKKAKK